MGTDYTAVGGGVRSTGGNLPFLHQIKTKMVCCTSVSQSVSQSVRPSVTTGESSVCQTIQHCARFCTKELIFSIQDRNKKIVVTNCAKCDEGNKQHTETEMGGGQGHGSPTLYQWSEKVSRQGKARQFLVHETNSMCF